MRISCTGFARVQDENGRLALLVNRGRLKRGLGRTLSPIGGAFSAMPHEIEALEVAFEAHYFEQGDDLRFRVEDPYVERVVTWFNKRTFRETSVLRELHEELVDETKILTPEDLVGVEEVFVKQARRDGPTHREVPERQTAYLVEVFDVNVPDAALIKLLRAAEASEPMIYFVRPDEIERGVTDDGTAIGKITETILL